MEIKKSPVQIVFLILIGIVGYFAYQFYSKNNNQKYNKAYLQRIQTLLEEQSTLQDSMDIIKQEKTIMMIPPQSEQLSQSSKDFINEIHTDIKGKLAEKAARQAEDAAWANAQRSNTLSAYNQYLKKYPKGEHVAEASAAILRIESNDNPSDDESNVPYGYNDSETSLNKKIAFKSIICLLQNEVSGKDRIKLTVNGTTYLSNQQMGVGDEISLGEVPSFSIKKNNPVRLTLIEQDDKGIKSILGDADDILMIVNFDSKMKIGTNSIEQNNSGARYKLVYEIKNR